MERVCGMVEGEGRGMVRIKRVWVNLCIMYLYI